MTSIGFDDPKIGFLESGGGVDQADLDLLKPITNQAELQARFPHVGDVHTVDALAEFAPPPGGGSILLDAGRTIAVVFPGSPYSHGGVVTTIEGDAVGPLVSGEAPISNLRIKNTNAAGSDVLIESLFGRELVIDTLGLIGENPGRLENALGATSIETISIVAPSPTATGLVIDGTIGALAFYRGVSRAPGGSPYTAITVLATCNVASGLAWRDMFIIGAVAGDYMLFIDPAATIPEAPIPTQVVGIQIHANFISRPAAMFAPGSLNNEDIRLLVTANTNGPPSRFLADVFMDTDGLPAATLVTTGLPAETKFVVPPTNGATATLVEQPLNSHHTLAIGSSTPPYRWSVLVEGPLIDLSGNVEWSADLERFGPSAVVRGFVQQKLFTGVGSARSVTFDLGAPGGAPDATYTVTINGTPFDEVSVSQTKAVVIANLTATIALGAEPVSTVVGDSLESFETLGDGGVAFTFSTSSQFDSWATISESRGIDTPPPAQTTPVAGNAPITHSSGDEYRVVLQTSAPGTDILIENLANRVIGAVT